MKYRNDLKYYIKADQLTPIEQFDDSIFESGESVYEVVRMYQGKVLFLEEHLERMQHSLDLIYGSFPCSKSAMKDDVNLLIQSNNTAEGNIKIELRKTSNSFIRLIYFIPHHYPTKEQIEKGIQMQFQFDERPNPNAKISNWKVRGNANRIIDQHQIYETLLVNSKGFITEGSRSSIFFIKGKQLYSAPEEWILHGITRLKVLQICKKINIDIVPKKIPYQKIHQFEAAFITGTSPGVLQIKQIEDTNFTTNHALYQQIRQAFTRLINA